MVHPDGVVALESSRGLNHLFTGIDHRGPVSLKAAANL
jgi:hypothetical protein